MSNFLKNFFQEQKQKFLDEGYLQEDRVVFGFLNKLNNKNCRYLEVGSGLGRFPLKLKKKYKTLNIECIEINPNLAKITAGNGLRTVVGDVKKMPFENESFDVVHCSHVIEHFSYPQIARVLDELVRVAKKSAYIILRSPLMHKDFYLDIDHVRPYPPETILSYFYNQQQQKVGKANLQIIHCWYRRENFKLVNIGISKIKYFFNALFAFLWMYIKFPFSRKNGYVLILKKIN